MGILPMCLSESVPKPGPWEEQTVLLITYPSIAPTLTILTCHITLWILKLIKKENKIMLELHWVSKTG